MSARTFEITKHGGLRAVDPRTGGILAERPAAGTSIVQLLSLGAGVVVREDYCHHPRGVSNVYCVDADLREVWSAELPSASDAYANPITLAQNALHPQHSSDDCRP